MKFSKLFLILIFLVLIILVFFPIVAFAQRQDTCIYDCKSLDECVRTGGTCDSSAGTCASGCCCRPKGTAPGTETPNIIKQISDEVERFGCLILSILFYLSAAIAALFILFAGIKYITSDSEGERCEARNRVVYAVIGLIVILIAVPLVNFFIPTINSLLALYSEDFKIPTVECPDIPFTGPTAPPTRPTQPPTPSEGIDIVAFIEEIICKFIGLVLYISFGLAALVIVYAGIKYITSADDPEERDKAKSIGANAIIGLIIVMLAIPLVNYITPYVLDCEKYLVPTTTTTAKCTTDRDCCAVYPGFWVKCVNNECIDPCTPRDPGCYECPSTKMTTTTTRTTQACRNDRDCCAAYPGFWVKCTDNVCDPCVSGDQNCYKCPTTADTCKDPTESCECCIASNGFWCGISVRKCYVDLSECEASCGAFSCDKTIRECSSDGTENPKRKNVIKAKIR